MTQCNSTIEPDSALSDENDNIYIIGKVNQTICDSNSKDNEQFIKRDLQTITLLHNHDLDHFPELATLREEACSFGGSWSWGGIQLPLDLIHSAELASRFHFTAKPKP